MTDATPNSPPYVRARDLTAEGTSKATAYRKLLTQSSYERIGHGLYRAADLPQTDWDLLEISARAQRATLCLTSALAWHELTDEIPAKYDLAIPRGAYAPRLRAPTDWHRFDPTTYDLGRERHELPGEPGAGLWVYAAERTLADMFRVRGYRDDAVAGLRNWLRISGNYPSSLVATATELPGSTTALIEALTYLSA